MQVVVETLNNLERRAKITVPAEEIDNKVGLRLEERKKTTKLKGFRPGKVPLNLIKQQQGEAIRQEVISEVIGSSFYDAVEKQHLKLAGPPKIEPKQLDAGAPLEYEAVFEVYPVIEFVDLTGVKITKRTAKVSPTDVDKVLQKLRKQHVMWHQVTRPSQNDDRITIDFEGTMNDEPFPGGAAKDTDLVLGTKSMIPGFEEGLIGKNAGEEVELNLEFPTEYPHKELAGKPVKFKVMINNIMEPELPTLDDKFAQLFDVKSIEDLTQEVTKSMERELKRAEKEDLKHQVLDHLLELNPINIPNTLVDAEIKQMQEQFFQRVTGKPLKKGQQLPPIPREHFEEQAKRRVRLALLLSDYVDNQKLKPDATRVQALVEEVASAYDNPEQIASYYYQNKAQLAQIENLVLEEQAIEKLLENTEIEEQTVNYEDLVKTQA